MPDIRIAIIGAGPSGLTLARLLQKYHVACEIFELDAHEHERDQGGTVDLHPRFGQLALQEAGLMEEFKRVARPEGDADKLVKYDGTVLADENLTAGKYRPTESADRPEIDRTKLRELLLSSLQPDTVKWSKKLVSVQRSTPETPVKYELEFTDGVEKGFDLVVGADGAWSKVRALLTDEKPYYSGVSAIELWALDVDKRKPWLSDYVGQGTLFMFDEGRMIACQRNGAGGVRTYAAVRQPEKWIEDCGIDWSVPEMARKVLVQNYFADCGEDLKRLILESDDKLVARPFWMAPIGMKWKSQPGLTLIGDAAHLMTPFAGVGVNLAMADALDLANVLVRCHGDREKIPTAIKTFENAMLKRAEKYARKTAAGMESHFSAGGAEERAKLMRLQGTLLQLSQPFRTSYNLGIGLFQSAKGLLQNKQTE